MGEQSLAPHKQLLGWLVMMCNEDVLCCVGTQWQLSTANSEQNGII